MLVIVWYKRTNPEEIRGHYLLIYSTRVDQVFSALHLNVAPKCLLPINYWANFGPRLKVAQQNFRFTKRVGRVLDGYNRNFLVNPKIIFKFIVLEHKLLTEKHKAKPRAIGAAVKGAFRAFDPKPGGSKMINGSIHPKSRLSR